MIKHIFLIRGRSEERYAGFSTRIDCLANNLAGDPGCRALSVTLTEAPPPRVSVIPFRKEKIAAISLFTEESSELPEMDMIPGFAGAYKVTEALPVEYKKTWPAGDVTPGLCMLTLFRQKKSIARETFIHRWHNSHTPLSLKIHPLWHYNRNVVEEMISDGADPFDGIVEEHVKTPSDLLNPFKFFGNPLIIIPRMLQVWFDVKSFIDYPSIETYITREYWKTPTHPQTP